MVPSISSPLASLPLVYSQLTKPKVKVPHPPKYNGLSHTFDNYAFLLKNYCKANSYEPSLSIQYAISTLEDKALEWYKDVTNNLGMEPF